MELKDFHQDLIETVRARAESSRDFVRASFVEECGEMLTAAEELLGFEVCRFEGVVKRKKLLVDGYSFDDADNSLSLMVCGFFNEDNITTFNTADVQKIFGMLRNFLEESLAGALTDGSVDESQPGYGLASDLMDWHSKISKYRFYFISDGLLKTRTKDWLEQSINGTTVELHIWDVGRFHSAYISATGRDELIVDFSATESKGLPCLAAAHSEGEYKAYLCMISGDSLADIYEKYGSRLLEGNVRTFLSAKGKVNSAIQNTIRVQPEMFFAFNNGIAATAENIELQVDDEGLHITSATNLQIVNGGQTTASLALAKRGGSGKKDVADLSKVMVQMKLSVLPPERAGALTPEIARFANSQNKVSDADFFSNHPFHVRMEDFSRRLFTSPTGGAQHGTHWFYERARGQYVNEQAKLTPSQKKQFHLQNPRSQLFTKTDVAKFENTWKEQPHKVSMGAQKNFMFFADSISKSWSSDGRNYSEEYFRSLIALAIIFRNTESIVTQQDWYQGGYRANIVTYSIAKLHNIISEEQLGKQLNLRIIWDKQRIDEFLSDQIAAIAKHVFHVLTDPDRPKDNVTEWAKMQACWEQVRDRKIPLSTGFVETLQDLKGVCEVSENSKVVQKLDDGIEIQMLVVDVPGVEWTRMLNWGVKNDKLSPKQISLLRGATLIPKKLPSEKQCVEIWKIRNRFIELGYLAF